MVETMSLELDRGPNENVELISLFYYPDLANYQFCHSRALCFNASMLLLLKELTPRAHITAEACVSPNPNLRIAGFKTAIYLSYDPDALRGLENYSALGDLHSC